MRKRTVLVLGAVAAGLATLSSYRPVIVLGQSMTPNLKDKQVVWMEKRSGQEWSVQPGDVVVFRIGRDTYIKRVAAVGGQDLQLAEWHSGIREILQDPFIRPRVIRLARQNPGLVRVVTERIPAGAVFVTGDNTSRSLDSRHFGPVPEQAVLGRLLG